MPQPFADAKTIFNALALEYDAYRPGYPTESLAYIIHIGDLNRTSTIADIGAGTGRIALDLAPQVRLVYAVDTANLMLEQLQEVARKSKQTNVYPIEAPGERTGLRSESLDLVVLSQVFHWMDQVMALREVHRILKPGRPMALIWNEITNNEDAYHIELQELIKQYNPAHHGGLDIISQDFPRVIEASGLFTKPRSMMFPFKQQYAPESFIGYMLSKSFVGVGIPRPKLPAFMQEAHEILHRHFGSEKIEESYQAVVLSANALTSS